jgi:hypothetical protein
MFRVDWLLVGAWILVVRPIWAGDSTAKVSPTIANRQIDFASDVAPILARCQSCHGSDQQMSGLRLDTRVFALAGSNSGAVIIPGRPAESRILQVVAGEGRVVMPPVGRRLSLKRWL